MSQDTATPKRGLKRPVEVVRAELLKDPDTKRIAKAVGMPLEEYVELVLQYAQDKDKEPMIKVVSDEELHANGFKTMTNDEAANLLIKAAKGELGVNEEFEKSEFTPGQGRPPARSSGGAGGSGFDQGNKGGGSKS
jgi:DNA-directed RNA polymerase specialized sigma subunit